MYKSNYYPLFSLFVENKSIEDSNFIKYKALDIIYKKSFKDLEHLIINDSNFKEMIKTNNSFEVKNIAFEYYKEKEQVVIIKFTKELEYEDFIEKINFQPNKKDFFQLENKVFKNLCLKAIDNPFENYVLILDNYQIGNIDNIFEEIKFLLDSNKRLGNCDELRVKLKYEKCDFGIPSNLYILGVISKV